MKQNNQQYAMAFYQACQGLAGKELSGVINEFVKLLIKEHKLKSVDKIVAEFVSYAKKQEGIMDIAISTARELDKKVMAEITKVFGAQTTSQEKIDQDLLGGIIIKTDEVIFDASLQTQLNKLKNAFTT